MRTSLSTLLIVFCITLLSCKKEESTNTAPLSLVGTWEIRKSSGGFSGLTFTYPPGNGYTANFTASDFVFDDNGTGTYSGTYTIVRDTTNNPPGNYFLYMNGKKYGLWLEKDRFFYWDDNVSDYYYHTYERIK